MADGFQIKIEGVKELQNTFKKMDKDIQDIITEAVHEGGQVVKTAAKGHVHVISGKLRDSIDELHVNKNKGRIEVQVGSDVRYATVEEFRVGGKYPGSHSYMRWSLDTKEQEIVSTIEKKLKSSLSRYK